VLGADAVGAERADRHELKELPFHDRPVAAQRTADMGEVIDVASAHDGVDAHGSVCAVQHIEDRVLGGDAGEPAEGAVDRVGRAVQGNADQVDEPAGLLGIDLACDPSPHEPDGRVAEKGGAHRVERDPQPQVLELGQELEDVGSGERVSTTDRELSQPERSRSVRTNPTTMVVSAMVSPKKL